MKTSPLVSIVVPCYNHQDFVKKCLNSVICQTYKNIEIIVIDDGSTDKTPEILQAMAAENKFIIRLQKNIGLSKTLNKAIKSYAHGKYISVIASDDYWELDKISKQVIFLEASDNYALVFGKAKIVDADDIVLGNLGDQMPDSLTFDSLILDNKVIASTTMFRKDVWELVGGFNEDSYIEDWDLWLKMAEKFKIGFINENLGFYRRHGSNMSNNLLRMENSKTDILKQWSSKSIYPIAIKRHILLKSNILARNSKMLVLQILFKNIKYIFNIRYFTAWARLIFTW